MMFYDRGVVFESSFLNFPPNQKHSSCLLLPESEFMSVLDDKLIHVRVYVRMPANMRFCAVQIEVICLLLCSTDVQLCEVLSFYKRFKKKTNTCLSQETFTTCCMNMSHMFKVIMSCEETFYVHGHFPSSSGGCGGLRNPFPKILYPPSLVPQNFLPLRARTRIRGTMKKTCEAKCFIRLE